MIFFLLAFAMVLLAASAQALTGFGFALILTPLLSLIYDPKATVAVTLMLGAVCNAPLLARNWRLVKVRQIAILCTASFIGNIAGVRLLLFIDSSLLRLVIGVMVVILALPMFFEYRREVKNVGMATVVVGLVSGALIGSTTMGGPPVVLFGLNQNWSKEAFRANMIAYLEIISIASVFLLTASGIVTPDVVKVAVISAPAILPGIILGSLLFYRVPLRPLRRLIILFVIATGLLSAHTGLAQLLG